MAYRLLRNWIIVFCFPNFGLERCMTWKTFHGERKKYGLHFATLFSCLWLFFRGWKEGGKLLLLLLPPLACLNLLEWLLEVLQKDWPYNVRWKKLLPFSLPKINHQHRFLAWRESILKVYNVFCFCLRENPWLSFFLSLSISLNGPSFFLYTSDSISHGW